MKELQLTLNDVLIKIKEEYGLANALIADVLNVSQGAITGYLKKTTFISKEKGKILNNWLIENFHKSIYDYVFKLVNEDGFLFHGSKSQITTGISLNISSDSHDFGRGFYLGESFLQSSTWASDIYSKGFVYKYKLNVSNLKMIEITGIDWVLFIAINRKKIVMNKDNKAIFEKYNNIINGGYDIIVGKIADDRMGMSMEDFFHDRMTDKEVYECLSQLKIGNQYCLRTKKAIDQLELIETYQLEKNLKEMINEYALSLRNEAVSKTMVVKINRKKVNSGELFSELIKKYGK